MSHHHWHGGGAANTTLRSEVAQRECIEASRHQTQEIKAVGQLTGGTAHDFGYMLQAIGASLEVIRRQIKEGRLDEAVRFVEFAGAAVERAAALICRPLACARRQALVPQIVGLDELILGLGELVRHTVGPAIEVDLRTNSALWMVSCDPNQLASALLSLVTHARNAMPEGGRLFLTTRPMCLAMADLASQTDARPGEYVEITVVDTGTGMHDAAQTHIFEPLFTTKSIGPGTGLGLCQLHGFIQQSGGLVQLDSNPGQGTTVRLYLPRHRRAQEDIERESGTAVG